MLIRPHSSIWAWNDNILCKSVTKGGDLTAPWVLVCLGTVWYSISQNISKPPCGSCPSACARTLPSWSRSTSPFCSDPSSMLSNCEHRSSDPESHPKVGFESVSGFGFRRLKPTFAVGFGFRVSSIETHLFAVGFGFRVSSIETHFRCRFRVSGFVACKTNFRCRFRVSGFVDWNPLLLSVSGFGFRRLKPTFAVGFGIRVSGFVDWS